MTYDLTNIFTAAIVFVAIAGLAVLLAVGTGAEFLASNRKVRVARHESIPTYYSNLLGAH